MTSAYSQLGGLLDGLIDWLSDAFNNFIVSPIFNFFSYIIGAIFYGIQMGLFYIMDAIQLVFRRVAGLDVYYDNGVAVEGDLVEKFLTDPTVQAVFFSILIAAIILLFITTFIAVLKTEFDEKDNAKGPVFKSAIKAIAYFAIVPIVCIMGITVSNIVLRMLDGATSQDARSFSTQVFVAAAWDCNRARSDADFARDVWENQKWIPGLPATYDQEAVAMAIDQAFRAASSPTTGSATVHGNKGWGYDQTFTVFSITSYDTVFYYYNPISYNYLIGYVAGFAVCMMMLNLLIGVIQRIFELCVLFVLSPVAVALMPLDGGGRYSAWRSMFVRRVFSAYGPILGMNLVFMVLTLMQDVQIFPDGGINGLYNAIVQILFIFTGLVSIRSLVDLVTELVGQGDALKQGEATGKQVKDFGAKAIGVGANIAMGPARFAANAGRRAANWRNESKVRKNMAFDENNNVVGAGTEGASTYQRNSMWTNAKGAMASAGNRMTFGRRFGDSESLQARNQNKERRQKTREFMENGGQITQMTGKDDEGNPIYENVQGRYHKLSNSTSSNVWAATGFGKKIEEGAAKFGPGVPGLEGFARRKKEKEEEKAEKQAREEYKKNRKIQEDYEKEYNKSKGGEGTTENDSKESPKNNLDTSSTPTTATGPGSVSADNAPVSLTSDVNVMNAPEVRIKQDNAEETPPINTTIETQDKPLEVREKYTVDDLEEGARREFERTGGNMTVDEFVAQRNDQGIPQKMTLNADTIRAEELQRERDESGTDYMHTVAQNADEINVTANSTETQSDNTRFQSNNNNKLKIDDTNLKRAIEGLETSLSATAQRISHKLTAIEFHTRDTKRVAEEQRDATQSVKNIVTELNEKTPKNKSNSGSGGSRSGGSSTPPAGYQ